MKATALVMAGGRGTRMTLPVEKPLLEVSGKPVIEHVLKALEEANKIESLIVTVSRHTPKTKRYIQDLGIDFVQTQGKDYVSDMNSAIKKLNLNIVLATAADLPLITSRDIDEILAHYDKQKKPAMTVAVPAKTKL